MITAARRSTVLFLALVLGQLEAAPPPNILFILCDDLGFGATGPTYQNERAARGDRSQPSFTTPSLDRLAAEGMQLRRHYAAAPICVSARASLLTGLTQGHSPIRDNAFDEALPDRPTLASVLRDAGYATAAIGKWGLQGGGEAEAGEAVDSEKRDSPAGWPGYPTKRGFDFFFGYVRHKDGHFHYPKEDGREVWENDHEVSSGLDLCYTTDLFTARAKRWITEHRERRSGQPFLLYLALDTPHAIMAYPSTEYPAGGGLGGGVQWTGRPGAMLNTSAGVKDSWCDPTVAEQTWDHDDDAATPEQPWPEVQKRFATSVRRIDAAVGDLMHLLRDLGIERDTLVVFTSDNGPTPESYLGKNPCNPDFFGTPGPFSGLKRDTLEGGIRVPTFVSWRGMIAAGAVDTSLSGQWDWLATFADLAGLPTPAFSDGVSLVPRLTGRGVSRPSVGTFEYFNPRKAQDYDSLAVHRGRQRRQMQTVPMDPYVGVRYDIQGADDDFEIYNLETDPSQQNNLAGQPGFTAVQLELKARALQARRPEPSAPRPYDGAAVPPVSVGDLEPGRLWCSLFRGQWDWVPDYRALRPVKTELVEKPDASVLSGESGGLAFTGFFHATEEADYTFQITSDHGGVLFLHDARVIDDVAEPLDGMRQGLIRLAAGWHPIRLYSRHTAKDAHLSATFVTDDGVRRPLSGDAVAAKISGP